MRIYEFESKVKPEVYIDMDGVLVDFFDAWAKLMGEKSFRDIKDIDKGLQAIRDTDDFWLNLKPTPNAGKLLALVRKLKGSYTILSSPLADDPRSEPHKRMWVEKNLKQFPPKKVIITGNKAKYAQQSDGTPNILIDDFGQNIDKWNAAGGIGVKHKDHKFDRTLQSLMQHLEQKEKVKEAWSEKYKRSINCSNPKGFSQKAHCAGRKKTNEAFIKPNFDYEWEEANRYPEFQKIGKDAWIELAKKGKAVTITSAKGISNTDATEPDSFSSLDKGKQARTLAQLEKDEVEMPIVAVYSDGHKELIGGNTRLTALMAKKIPATVWQFDVPDEVAELAENFAKSRKEELFSIQKQIDDISKDPNWRERKDELKKLFRRESELEKEMQLVKPGKMWRYDHDSLGNKIKENFADGKVEEGIADKLSAFADKILGKMEKWWNKQVNAHEMAWAEIEEILKPYAEELRDLIKDPNDFGMLMLLIKHNQGKKPLLDKLFAKIRQFGIKAVYKMQGLENKLATENFADGKVKGKSRPGRVKRAGASCNGSVTSLRKKAKNASGEKAKMYHWCANMKSGRNK